MLGNLPLAIAAGAKTDRGMTQADLVPRVERIERDVTWWVMIGRETVRMCRTEEEARYWLRITRRDPHNTPHTTQSVLIIPMDF
ncbi:MAG: hypothetical protein OXI71_14120, partial [Gemmatimonadota bacterium]|nr:hypothetical protein [Gemmatimonadota bacterium]